MASKEKKNNLISIVMGSQSDWLTMQNSETFLDNLNIPYEKKVISAHRTPKRLYNYAIKAQKNLSLIHI